MITTRRAYEELERDGLIFTRAGMGSFVTPAGATQMDAARVAHIRALITHALQEAARVGLSPAQVQELFTELLRQMPHSVNPKSQSEETRKKERE